MVPLATLVSLAIISLMGVLVNGLVCFLVYKYKTLMRNYTNGFVVSLAVSDILTSIVILCQYLIGFKNRIVVNIAYAIVMLSGVTNLCAVTYDRYIAVTQPLRYLNIMRKHCRKLLIGVWLTSIIVSALPVLWEGKGDNSGHKIYVILVQIFFIGIPFLFIVLSHCCIFYHAKKCSGKARRLSHVHVVKTREKSGCGISRRLSNVHVINIRCSSVKRTTSELKVARVFALVSLMFLLSWFPVIYYTNAAIFGRAHTVPRKLIELSPITIALGSIVNPLIYSLIKPDFRKALKKLLGIKRNTPGESSGSDPTSTLQFRMSQRNVGSSNSGNLASL